LKSLAIAFKSKDCCNSELSFVLICSAPGAGGKLGLAPGFEILFPIQTKGIRPVKIPVPPRI